MMDGEVMSLLAPWRCLFEGKLTEKMKKNEVKESDTVRVISQSIAREMSELAYSWDSEGAGKTEIVDEGNSMEYN